MRTAMLAGLLLCACGTDRPAELAALTARFEAYQAAKEAEVEELEARLAAADDVITDLRAQLKESTMASLALGAGVEEMKEQLQHLWKRYEELDAKYSELLKRR